MKTSTALSIAALGTAIMAESTSAMKAYLAYIPNGSLFSQELGHPDNDSSQFTDFATAFEAVGLSWTAAFCADTFPGSTMTNGAAFGDPCCTWSQGDTPDFTVTAFTTDPTTATVCASSSTPSSTTASMTSSSDASTTSSATSSASTDTTDAPAATIAAPTAASTTSSSTIDTSTTDVPATTTAPSTDDSTTTGGCRAKPSTATASKMVLRA
ncbi:hypothetical protein PHYBOEH_000730 [Phytophthora boehmeriae]|uniref:Temptin Cys/Cys disulfide domain-containing protein n=1 Tax=Phytophthora boehmeriae TaxID=109152 RepID=A0A8T1WWC1_9STRA|nr:hypothetical protein PHYBOEH_000730 [Phytophthora boehmeriae]